jgi:hypothetical protein
MPLPPLAVQHIAAMDILISVGEFSPDEAPTPPDLGGKRQWELSTASDSRPLVGSPSNSRLLPGILPQHSHTHAVYTHC